MGNKNNFDIQEYSFHNFSESEIAKDNVVNFDFKPLLKNQDVIAKESYQNLIKQERSHAKKSLFKINPVVEEHRGIKEQEEREYEERVQEEVSKRLAEIQDEAFKIGFDEGVNQGREEIFNEMRNVIDQKLDNFSVMVNDVLSTHEEIISKQKKEMYVLIRNLTKWIILRELKNDGEYVNRLLEKLLVESQTRNNLLIQVNSKDFKEMPEVLEHIKSKLGEIKNVRIEIDNAISSEGMIVESENGIINATMEEQFKSLDKLFEDVLVEV